MIKLQEEFYPGKLKALMQDELLYRMSMPDGSPLMEEWEPDFNLNRYVVMTDVAVDIDDEGTDIGFVQFNPISNICINIHSFLNSKYWGKMSLKTSTGSYAHDCYVAFEEWVLEHTGYLSIINFVPEQTCGHVLDFALEEGFVFVGRIPDSILFDDRIQNMIICQKTLNRSDT